jgi:hypothetical protein
VVYTSADVGSGRAVHYEWEQYVIDVLDRLAALETYGTGGTAVPGFFQGSGAPDDSLIAPAGSTYLDVTTGKIYRKD